MWCRLTCGCNTDQQSPDMASGPRMVHEIGGQLCIPYPILVMPHLCIVSSGKDAQNTILAKTKAASAYGTKHDNISMSCRR